MLIHQFFFNMKHKILLSLVAVLLTALSAQAYDFQSGDLYYNTTSDTTVEVAYQSKSSDNYQGLTTATIPETVTYNGTTYSVTSIGKSAFRGCSSIADIYCYATTPPVCDDDNTFSGVNEHCYIHVPTGTIPNYQVATGWRYFSNFLEISGVTAISEKTAISETEQQNKSSRKIIRDGQVLILRNGVTYDMMGNTL